jgi:hypothetical protein
LRRRRPTTPELEQAATLFRLQRHGIALPRLLAVGQRRRQPWQADSFLLTEDMPGHVDLAEWLTASSDFGLRRHAVRQLAELCRRLHRTGHYFDSIVNPRCLFAVGFDNADQAGLALSSAEGLRRSRVARPKWQRHDLQRLAASFSTVSSRTERLRFLLVYLDKRRLDSEARQLVGRILPHIRHGGLRPRGKNLRMSGERS